MNQLSTMHVHENQAPLAHEVSLSQSGYLRLSAVLKVYPISKSSWWQGVREGRLPSGIKLGPRTTAWRVEDIRSLLASISAGVQVRSCAWSLHSSGNCHVTRLAA